MNEHWRQSRQTGRGAVLCAALTLLAGCAPQPAVLHLEPVPASAETTLNKTMDKTTDAAEAATKTDAQWKKDLTPEQYHVLREKGTERAFTGKYWNLKDNGMYACAGCGQELFKSDSKYDSGCGWPSFTHAVESGRIAYHEDTTHGMRRTEVTCKKCGGHLGHVFDDGPGPTGKRYCINSASLTFSKD
jgi:peptide-methionine (R)-S-oxide reductase